MNSLNDDVGGFSENWCFDQIMSIKEP